MNSTSRIFWHFVGSPENIDWSKLKKPKDIIIGANPKSNIKSWEIVKEILVSKKLLATCNEKLYGYKETDKFCCLTDLPMKNLIHHRSFYGNVAIGFRSEKVYNNFTPVLYTPIQNFLKHAIEEKEENEEWTLAQLNSFGMDEDTALRSGYEKTNSGTYQGTSITIDYAKNSPLEKYILNFVKGTNFSDELGESFYEEREWRKVADFIFEYKDIAAIIVPKELVRKTIELLDNLKVEQVSILTWEVIEKT
jgi:hypothetical protein